MAFFKKKIAYEQFWIELYGGYLTSNFSLGASLRVLGSDLQKLRVSIDAALSELGISKMEIGAFGRVVALGSTCAVADHGDRKEFWRFKNLFEHSADGRDLKQDLEKFGLPSDTVLRDLGHAFLSGDVSRLDPWMLTRSEIYGDLASMPANSAVLFRQANVLTSFLHQFCSTHLAVPFSLIESRLHEARDQIVNSVGTVARARERMLSTYKPM